MRVNFVLPFYSRRPIGGLRVVYELASGLAARGHAVSIVHPRELLRHGDAKGLKARISRAMDRIAAVGGVPWIKLHPRVTLIHCGRVVDYAIPNADATFATSWQTADPVLALSAAKGKKLYLVMDFYPFLADKATLEATWRRGFCIATISSWLADMVADAGVPPRMIASISCGISPVHKLRRPIEGRARSVAMMYGTANYKASADGLAALLLARSGSGVGFEVDLFGANASRRPSGLPSGVRYHPLLSDRRLSDLYNSSSIFLSSSLAEGFCLPAAEAMASGCALVATDSGGVRDFAVHGVNSLLSPPGSPQLLAQNLVTVLTDEELRARLARAGVKATARLTWSAAVDRLEKLIL